MDSRKRKIYKNNSKQTSKNSKITNKRLRDRDKDGEKKEMMMEARDRTNKNLIISMNKEQNKINKSKDNRDSR